MKSSIKTFFNLVLAVVVTVSTTGFSLFTHTCLAGNKSEVSLNNHFGCCGDAEMPCTDVPTSDFAFAKKCCALTVDKVKSNEVVLTSVSLELPAVAFVNTPYTPRSIETAKSFRPLAVNGSPPAGRDLVIISCNFRI